MVENQKIGVEIRSLEKTDFYHPHFVYIPIERKKCLTGENLFVIKIGDKLSAIIEGFENGFHVHEVGGDIVRYCKVLYAIMRAVTKNMGYKWFSVVASRKAIAHFCENLGMKKAEDNEYFCEVI